jgi:hypothetical protein
VEFVLSSGSPRMRVLFGEATLLAEGGAPVTLVSGETLDFTLGREAQDKKAQAGQKQAEQLTPLVFTLSPRQGTPQVRSPGAQAFTPVREGPQALEEGSAFQLPPGARASLGAGALGVQLPSGGRGHVGAAGTSAQGERYTLALDAPEAQLSFAGEGARQLALTAGGRELSLRTGEQTSAALTQLAGTARLEVRTGEAEVSSGGVTQRVRAGEVAQLGPKGLTVAARPPPALVLAPAERVSVYAGGLSELGLGLPQEAGESVQVEVAAREDFSERLLAGRTRAGWVVVTPPASGELYWRTLSEDGKVQRSGQVRLLRERRSAASSRVRAEVAETGLKATVYFQSSLPAVTLSYAAREGAQAYRVRVYRAGELATPLLEKVVAQTQCAFEAGRLSEGSYLWYASPLDGRGAELTGGRMNRLDLVYDNSRSTLDISRPREEARVGKAGVEVQGVAPLGTRLFVNGQPVALGPKGRFAQRVPAADTLIFRLVWGGGSEAYWVRSLRRQR